MGNNSACYFNNFTSPLRIFIAFGNSSTSRVSIQEIITIFCLEISRYKLFILFSSTNFSLYCKISSNDFIVRNPLFSHLHYINSVPKYEKLKRISLYSKIRYFQIIDIILSKYTHSFVTSFTYFKRIFTIN